jgi:hypothetical protein
MIIQIDKIELEEITDQDRKLIEIQRRINEIGENNSHCEISLFFRDGKMAYWCEKTTHQ